MEGVGYGGGGGASKKSSFQKLKRDRSGFQTTCTGFAAALQSSLYDECSKASSPGIPALQLVPTLPGSQSLFSSFFFLFLSLLRLLRRCEQQTTCCVWTSHAATLHTSYIRLLESTRTVQYIQYTNIYNTSTSTYSILNTSTEIHFLCTVLFIIYNLFKFKMAKILKFCVYSCTSSSIFVYRIYRYE